MLLLSGAVFALGFYIFFIYKPGSDAGNANLAKEPQQKADLQPLRPSVGLKKGGEKTVKSESQNDEVNPGAVKPSPNPDGKAHSPKNEPIPDKNKGKLQSKGDGQPPALKEGENEPKTQGKQPPNKDSPKGRPENEIPAEIAMLVATLESGSAEEQAKAAEKLAALGAKAKPAARALCEASFSSSKEVSRNALLAIEKVAPELHEPIFTLIVDGKAANHLKAIAALERLGTKAKPAIGVMVHQIEKCRGDVAGAAKNGSGSIGWGSQTLVQVINALLTALPKIAPNDPQVFKTIVTATSPIKISFRVRDTLGQVRDTLDVFRDIRVDLMGVLAAKSPEHRKEVLAVLSPMLAESIEQTTKANAQQQLLVQKFGEVESICISMWKCENAANEIIAKTVIPQLKDLEFHKEELVRSRAKALRKRLEAGPPSGQQAFPTTGFLGQGSKKSFAFPMVAGKTYVIDLKSREFDSFLYLRDPSGNIVAEDDDSGGMLNAQIVYQCTKSGTYEIIAASLGDNGTGSFELDAKEQ